MFPMLDKKKPLDIMVVSPHGMVSHLDHKFCPASHQIYVPQEWHAWLRSGSPMQTREFWENSNVYVGLIEHRLGHLLLKSISLNNKKG